MATTYLQLLSDQATGNVLPAAEWNKVVGAEDRQARMMAALFVGGVKSGWALTSGATTVSSGQGQIGGCWCVTAAAQAISGLTGSGTRYIFARTDAGSAASGTLDFVARTTSGAVTNYDGVTSALMLGNADYNAATGLHAISSSGRDTWALDHGALAGLSDDDHPQYMRAIGIDLFPVAEDFGGTSAATASTFGSNCPMTAVKYGATATEKAAWQYTCPADFSGAITVTLDAIGSGLSGNVRLRLLSRAIASAETYDTTLASCAADWNWAVGGTNGHMRRTSVAWTTAKPSAGERGTIALHRLGAHTSDTMSGALRIIGLKLSFATAL